MDASALVVCGKYTFVGRGAIGSGFPVVVKRITDTEVFTEVSRHYLPVFLDTHRPRTPEDDKARRE